MVLTMSKETNKTIPIVHTVTQLRRGSHSAVYCYWLPALPVMPRRQDSILSQ